MAKRHESLDADIVEAPLYRRVVDALREDIVSGRSAVGDRLPTEDALCRRFGVSRHTVREAFRALREEGLVASRQGAGSTVVRRAARPLYTYSVSSGRDANRSCVLAAPTSRLDSISPASLIAPVRRTCQPIASPMARAISGFRR
jgi:DNA-binding GntR family transcriptional regulator